jgi:hypothetical protein
MITPPPCSIAGEQLDPAIRDAAQPPAAGRDRGQGLLKAARGGEGGQPAADEQVQRGRVQARSVRIRFPLGAMISPRSGSGLPPSRASTSRGRSAA